MRIILAGDCKTTPWKNGGGSTTEISACPADASLDGFDWRISMARVASDGPFSDFPGIDRTLAVINGNGMVLTIGANAPVTLSRGDEPLRFAGDPPTAARLLHGEIIDLNVMTRRGRFDHRVQRVAAPMSHDFAGDELAVVLSIGGGATVTAQQQTALLDHGDAVLIDREATACFRIVPAAECYLVLLRRAA
jgi:uncharacterized protein